MVRNVAEDGAPRLLCDAQERYAFSSVAMSSLIIFIIGVA